MSSIRYEPVSLFNQLNNEISHFFNIPRIQAGARPEHDWMPAVDIREEAERYVLIADIPGVDRKDIEITLEKGVLTVRGERPAPDEKQRNGYRHRERVQGSFMRRFTLPETVDTANISATIRDGVLEVGIPRQARPEPRKVTVN
jgi:HSP20 family protein